LPHRDELGCGRRRGRSFGPGGDPPGRARTAPVHPHQALPDRLGSGARVGRDVQRGWIPASVSNDAAGARRGRQSAALLYLKLNDGHERNVYAPAHHREIVARTIELCELRGTVADPPAEAALAERTEMHVEVDRDHNLALLTVLEPGADLEEAVGAERHHLFHRANLDAVYVDLPLERPATALVADRLERLGVSYAGIFPNRRTDGDVLRMQSLHRVRVKADDVVVASDHGRELLDYVLADLPQAS
jgi:hypothetical protein